MRWLPVSLYRFLANLRFCNLPSQPDVNPQVSEDACNSSYLNENKVVILIYVAFAFIELLEVPSVVGVLSSFPMDANGGSCGDIDGFI